MTKNPRGFCCTAVDPCLRNLVNGTSLPQGREEKQCIFTKNFGCRSYSFERVIIQKDTTAERGGNRVSGSLSWPHHSQCFINLPTWWNHRAGKGGSSICETSRVTKGGAGRSQRQQGAEKASCVTGLMCWFSSQRIQSLGHI